MAATRLLLLQPPALGDAGGEEMQEGEEMRGARKHGDKMWQLPAS